jgi:hypothetical protein
MDPRKLDSPGADVFKTTEGDTNEGVMRVFVRPGVVGEPGMCGSSLRENREVSGSACGWTPQVRIGKTRSRSR